MLGYCKCAPLAASKPTTPSLFRLARNQPPVPSALPPLLHGGDGEPAARGRVRLLLLRLMTPESWMLRQSTGGRENSKWGRRLCWSGLQAILENDSSRQPWNSQPMALILNPSSTNAVVKRAESVKPYLASISAPAERTDKRIDNCLRLCPATDPSLKSEECRGRGER